MKHEEIMALLRDAPENFWHDGEFSNYNEAYDYWKNVPSRKK